MSSARNGLTPKSTGGRMGMGGKMVIGGLVALGVAEGVKDYRKISTSRRMNKMNNGTT